jgi:D-amino-acid oxidase
MPELSPSYDAASGVAPKPEDLDSIIVRNVIGFRPARTGGLRLERGEDIVADSTRVKVFHNYGHSGAGWQASWGCAEDVVKLLDSTR